MGQVRANTQCGETRDLPVSAIYYSLAARPRPVSPVASPGTPPPPGAYMYSTLSGPRWAEAYTLLQYIADGLSLASTDPLIH